MTLASRLCDLNFKIVARAKKKNIRSTPFVSHIGLVAVYSSSSQNFHLFPPSELQLPLHPHRRQLHTQSDGESRLLLRGRQESCGWDQGPPGGVWQRRAAQDLQVRYDLRNWSRYFYRIGRKRQQTEFSKYECVLSYSERGPRVHYGESDIGQKEQRWAQSRPIQQCETVRG